MAAADLEFRIENVEFRRAELKGQDNFCHFWLAAEELGEVVN